jgi:hypothetical protein
VGGPLGHYPRANIFWAGLPLKDEKWGTAPAFSGLFELFVDFLINFI